MEDIQQIVVNEHIDDLRRDAQGLRTARELREERQAAAIGHPVPARADRHGARVRLGQWLIGVGMAVSGSPGDSHGGAAGQAT